MTILFLISADVPIYSSLLLRVGEESIIISCRRRYLYVAVPIIITRHGRRHRRLHLGTCHGTTRHDTTPHDTT